jgi:segregation and condensation protein B
MEKELAVLEAVLFSASEPLSIEQLSKLTKLKPEQIKAALNKLKQRYSSQDSGINLLEFNGSWRLVVKSEFSSFASKIAKADLSKGLLKVLSLIAYNEPASQADIVRVIGNRTYDYVRRLEQMGFIKSEKKSRTRLLRTTPVFEAYFGKRKEELKRELKKIAESKSSDQQSA